SGGVLSRVADLNTPIPDGSGNFADFAPDTLVSGSVVAFQGFGSSGQQGIYVLTAGGLTRVADLSTPVPGGTRAFTNVGLVGLNRDVVAAAGDGSSGQRGFYLFHDGVLSQAGNLNLPVPSGTGSFTDVTAASFSEGNLAFKGFGSAGEIGI